MKKHQRILRPRLIRALAPVMAAVLSSALPSLTSAAEDTSTVNVYNWSNYIAPETVPNFEKATGIKVNYDTYDANETVHAKLIAGHVPYDIVVPSSNWAQLQMSGGLLQKLDKSQIPNLKNLDPAIMQRIAQVDPGNDYMVPWAWGVTTVGINVDKVKAALGGMPMPADPLDLLFKPEYVGKLKSCGVSVLDTADDVFPAALNYLGHKTDSRVSDDYNEAAALLARIRPSITLFSSSGYINDLANGAICLALGWSGDFAIARHEAIKAKTGENVRMLLSDKGGELWYAVMAIPASAPHPQNAMKWINYVLEGKVHAELTNSLFYPSGNLAAAPFVKPEIQQEIALTPEVLARFKISAALNNETRRLRQRLYVKFKTGV